MKKNIGKFIPVEVISHGKRETWYIDITELTYRELVKFREELAKKHSGSLTVLDSLIQEKNNHYDEDYYLTKREMIRKKEPYRNRRAYVKIKRRQGR